MKTIITYGTFDLFHVGHLRLLKRLKEQCDELVVGISSDEFNSIKGKSSFFSYEERSEIVLGCRYVDRVFPEHTWDQKRSDIKRYQANIFAIGDDWEGKFDDLHDVCEVMYLARTEEISSTKIKSSLSKLSMNDFERLEGSLYDALNILKAIASR